MTETMLPDTAHPIATREPEENALEQLKDQVRLVSEAMKAVMQEGVHYARIFPRAKEPILLQPGADVLSRLFNLAPKISIERQEDGYLAKVSLIHKRTGEFWGDGYGSCYRSERPRDPDNTILKMAVKRAKVAAILNATGATDLFTQDLEDIQEEPRKMKVSQDRETALAACREAYSAAVKAGVDVQKVMRGRNPKGCDVGEIRLITAGLRNAVEEKPLWPEEGEVPEERLSTEVEGLARQFQAEVVRDDCEDVRESIRRACDVLGSAPENFYSQVRPTIPKAKKFGELNSQELGRLQSRIEGEAYKSRR